VLNLCPIKPGYDDSAWEQCSPLQGRNSTGITAYRAEFDLNIPATADVPLAFDLELDESQPYRSTIWVNGWQFGRYVRLYIEVIQMKPNDADLLRPWDHKRHIQVFSPLSEAVTL
jgi:hypothetical protein